MLEKDPSKRLTIQQIMVVSDLRKIFLKGASMAHQKR